MEASWKLSCFHPIDRSHLVGGLKYSNLCGSSVAPCSAVTVFCWPSHAFRTDSSAWCVWMALGDMTYGTSIRLCESWMEEALGLLIYEHHLAASGRWGQVMLNTSSIITAKTFSGKSPGQVGLQLLKGRCKPSLCLQLNICNPCQCMLPKWGAFCCQIFNIPHDVRGVKQLLQSCIATVTELPQHFRLVQKYLTSPACS